ncbi:MAG: protein kinase [Polyangiaceae bacterium]|nr:protein kinase [Polyangiaceae bacterium]
MTKRVSSADLSKRAGVAASAASVLVPGSTVLEGKYRLESVLGEGGMGIVYAARHLELDQLVAVKVVREELTRKEEWIERMLAEARVSARLRSEHVARVLDVGRLESGSPFIVMELLDGEDLSSCLAQNGRVPLGLAVTYLLQACEALAEAHAVGIVHRDVKPDNLFLTTRADGAVIVKVLDFGISKNVSEERKTALTNPKMVIGSPDYMAPEQMRAGADVDPRSDIWSLGAVMYQLLTGHRPFEADSLPVTCARVLADEPTPPRALVPSLPEDVEQIILKCLEKERDKRFATVADFACALAPHAPPNVAEMAERIVRVASSIRHPIRATASGLPRPIVKLNDSRSPVSFTAAPTLAMKRRWSPSRVAVVSTFVAAGTIASLALLRGVSAEAPRVAATKVEAAAATALPAPIEAAEAPSELDGDAIDPEDVAQAVDTADVVAATELVATSTPAATASPRRAPSRAKPSAGPTKPSAQPAVEPVLQAWDPDSFGGRR